MSSWCVPDVCLDHESVTMNITLKMERPVSSFLWNSFRGFSRASATVVKDDPYTNFAIKQKAETIHQLLGSSYITIGIGH